MIFELPDRRVADKTDAPVVLQLGGVEGAHLALATGRVPGEIVHVDGSLPRHGLEIGLAGASQVGRLMGAVMKAHKDEVDAALVRRIAEEELAG